MKKILAITVVALLQLSVYTGLTQNTGLKFNLVEGPNGKPLGKVTAITQDRHGYIWLCGQGEDSKCLYRYDGNRMVAYRHDNSNPNSLGGTSLETIYADAYGLIWIGFGDAGLDQFNPVTGIFKHYRHSANDSGSLSSNNVWAILRDRQGRTWVGTDKGLDLLDEKTGKFSHFRNESGNAKSLSCDKVRAIYQDRKGTIWIGTGFPFAKLYPDSTGGLNRLNPDGTFTRYLYDSKDPHSLINNKVRSIFEDSRGVFWIGTSGDGLHTMDREKGIFERHLYDPAKPGKLSRPPLKKELWKKNNDQVTFICEDSTGAIWIGTMLAGINRYDPVAKTITLYEYSNGFPDGSSWAGFTSTDGVVWIATEEDHLYRVDPFHRSLHNINTKNQVNVMMEDKKGYLWVSTDGNGLLKYDQHKNLIRQYMNDPKDSFSIPYNQTSGIFQNQEDTIWVGTRSALRILDERTQKFSRFPDHRILKDSADIGFPKIFQDSRGIMWFSRWGLGLTRYDPANHSFKHFLFDEKDSTSISSNSINSSLVEERSGIIWVGGLGGICRLNNTTDQFKRYLPGTFITNLFIDSGGSLWAGSPKGLFRYDQKADNFFPFFDPLSEINSITVGGIAEDNAHNLWLISPSGIIKVNPQTKETFIYGSKFGILPNTLAPWTVSIKNSRGEMIMGHHNGFYVFRPEEMVIKTNFNILISALFINNLPIVPGKGNIIQRPPEEITDLDLKYNQNNIAFHFSAIDYRDPESIKYFTMLEGNDNIWREVKEEKSSYYFNLQRGKYIYRVKAFNSDGTKAEKEIIIRIHPPWWETWWAYLLYFVLLVTALWAFIRWRTRSLQKEKIILEEKVGLRTRELKKEKEIVESTLAELKSAQAQLIQSEKMASLGELTAGIAHEIQNPLNFVNNFSEINSELIEELKNEMLKQKSQRDELFEDQLLTNIKKNEEKISHHGKRADAIVKGMLQHSRTSAGQKEATDINALAAEYLRLSYHGIRARDKNFSATLETFFDESIGKINIVPQDIGRVLLNLYNNAFYALAEKNNQHPEDYSPTVTLSTKKMTGQSGTCRIAISVSDNGMGIPQKVVDKIFQPFFTTKPTGQGTGLGLSLAYDIIKAHGGEIKVTTEEGKGSVFSIELPQ